MSIWDADLVSLWGYERIDVDESGRRTGAPAADARILHRRTSQVRDLGSVGDAATSPRHLHARGQETWYFSDELRSQREGRRTLAGRPETLEQYLALFDGAQPGQRIGENSPAYLMSEHAARRITQAQPDARIIAILREPASFLRSFHLQCLRNHVETEKEFGKAIELESARREGRRIPRNSGRPTSCCTPTTCATWSSSVATTTCFRRASGCWY